MSSDNERKRVAAQLGYYCILLGEVIPHSILAKPQCWASAVLVRDASRLRWISRPQRAGSEGRHKDTSMRIMHSVNCKTGLD